MIRCDPLAGDAATKRFERKVRPQVVFHIGYEPTIISWTEAGRDSGLVCSISDPKTRWDGQEKPACGGIAGFFDGINGETIPAQNMDDSLYADGSCALIDHEAEVSAGLWLTDSGAEDGAEYMLEMQLGETHDFEQLTLVGTFDYDDATADCGALTLWTYGMGELGTEEWTRCSRTSPAEGAAWERAQVMEFVPNNNSITGIRLRYTCGGGDHLIHEIIFGRRHVLENVANVKYTAEVEPIGQSMAAPELVITVHDPENLWDPQNPKGQSSTLARGMKVSFRWLPENGLGFDTEIEGGLYGLYDWHTGERGEATFSMRPKIFCAQELKYTGSGTDTLTLGAMADELETLYGSKVMEAGEFSQVVIGNSTEELSLPDAAYQAIQAAGGAARVRPDGVIEAIAFEEQSPAAWRYALSACRDLPLAEITPPVKMIVAHWHETEVAGTGTKTEVTIPLGPSKVDVRLFREASAPTTTSSGMAEIIAKNNTVLRGTVAASESTRTISKTTKDITRKEAAVEIDCMLPPDMEAWAAEKEVQNAFVCSFEQAERLGGFARTVADYRLLLTLQDRGILFVQPGDTVEVETAWGWREGILTRQEFTYTNGILEGRARVAISAPAGTSMRDPQKAEIAFVAFLADNVVGAASEYTIDVPGTYWIYAYGHGGKGGNGAVGYTDAEARQIIDDTAGQTGGTLTKGGGGGAGGDGALAVWRVALKEGNKIWIHPDPTELGLAATDVVAAIYGSQKWVSAGAGGAGKGASSTYTKTTSNWYSAGSVIRRITFDRSAGSGGTGGMAAKSPALRKTDCRLVSGSKGEAGKKGSAGGAGGSGAQWPDTMPDFITTLITDKRALGGSTSVMAGAKGENALSSDLSASPPVYSVGRGGGGGSGSSKGAAAGKGGTGGLGGIFIFRQVKEDE